MSQRKFAVIYERSKNGWGATVNELGCIATGPDYKTVRERIQGAVRASIADRLEHDVTIPIGIELAEILEVSGVRG